MTKENPVSKNDHVGVPIPDTYPDGLSAALTAASPVLGHPKSLFFVGLRGGRDFWFRVARVIDADWVLLRGIEGGPTGIPLDTKSEIHVRVDDIAWIGGCDFAVKDGALSEDASWS